jgi:hypothetical protein
MKSDKEKQFFIDLFNDIGIPKDTIEFSDVEDSEYCTPADSEETCQLSGWDFDFPTPVNYDPEDVLNPKDVIEDAREKLRDNGVSEQFDDVLKQMKYGIWAGDENDLVAALALPSLLTYEASSQMETIADTVDEWDEEKKQATIMAFVTAILVLVPIAGQFVGSISSLASLSFIIEAVTSAASWLGGVGTGTYQLLDGENPVLTSLSMILSPLGFLDIAAISMSASVADSMAPEDLEKLGPALSDVLTVARKTSKVCAVPLMLRSTDHDLFKALPMTGLNGERI